VGGGLGPMTMAGAKARQGNSRCAPIMPSRSPAPWRWLAALALCATAMTPAFAQVIRCTDAKTGQVTYTDGKCAAGTTAREVEAKRSAEDIEQDRKAAERAIELKQQRLQLENANATAQALRDAEQERLRAARAAATVPPPKDYARSPECASSRRNLELASSSLSRTTYDQELRIESAQRQMDLDCLGPQGYAELERARANQPRIVVAPPRQPAYPTPVPQKPYLTNCGNFECTDSTGARYPRAGPGRFPGNDGVCRSKGGQAPC
jgi:multidrug efflux pump subunit AcrA (membrane-fusion protein)